MGKIKFHILHVNDLHSHFESWPKVTQLIEQHRKNFQSLNEPVLTFDIGDHADRVSLLTDATLGKANVSLMNEVRYDAVTIGNNEGITFSKEALSSMYEEANFPVLVANLFEKDGAKPNWVKRYEIINLKDHFSVAVIGLTAPYRVFYEQLGWKIEEPQLLLPSLIEEVRGQADFVILLSHLGLNVDEQIATEIEGIDLIIGGHTHHVLKEGSKINNTYIHQAGKFGKYVGKISVTYQIEEKKLTNHEATCIHVSEGCLNEKTERLLNRLKKHEVQMFAEQVCEVEHPVNVSWEKRSLFPELLASALKEWCNAEIGMVNSGVLLSSLPKGKVTKADLHRVCPHPINPCTIELTGQVLKEAIQHAASVEMTYKKFKGFGFRGKVMGLIVFDGVEYESTVLSDGLTHVRSILVNGEVIDSERTYRVATVDMFTFGQLFPSVAKAKKKQYFMPELLRDLLAWKLSKYN